MGQSLNCLFDPFSEVIIYFFSQMYHNSTQPNHFLRSFRYIQECSSTNSWAAMVGVGMWGRVQHNLADSAGFHWCRMINP